MYKQLQSIVTYVAMMTFFAKHTHTKQKNQSNNKQTKIPQVSRKSSMVVLVA